jgi:uncharacterized protein YacL
MPDRVTTIIVDTSVLIDLRIGQIAEPFFALPYTFASPDFIIAELDPAAAQLVIDLGLRNAALRGAQITRIVQLRAQHRRLSVPDLAALLLAQLEEAILLTGDGALRSLAEGNGIEVHDMLWVLDEMIREGVLVSARAVRALETMLENGSRLPEAECRACLRRWTEA